MVQASDVQDAPVADLVRELDRLAVDAMADWKVPGAAVAVVQDGKVALASTYGKRDVEAGRRYLRVVKEQLEAGDFSV